MTQHRDLDSMLDTVRIGDVCTYLVGNGWKKTDFRRREVLRFEGPNDDEGKPIVQIVPATEGLSDFKARIGELVEALSVIEERTAADILRNITTPTCDILRVRLDTSVTRTGSLPLGFVSQFVDNLRNLLVFAACGEMQNIAYFQRALKKGTDFANKCRLAATQSGSFVAVVESPVTPPANQEQVVLKDYPFERRFMTFLAEGLALVEDATSSGEADAILNPKKRRVNGNMCEALLGLKPDDGDATIEIGISWSHAWPAEEDVPQRVFSYAGKAFEQIEAFARALRLDNKPKKRELHGRIVKLSAEDPMHGDEGNMDATLRVETADAPRSVHLLLDRGNYRTACNAHRDGQTVKVTGVLERTDSRWILFEIEDFSIVGSVDAG